MAVSCSWPLAVYCDLNDGIESIIRKSIDIQYGYQMTPGEFVGFRDRDLRHRFRAKCSQTDKYLECPTERKCMFHYIVSPLPRPGSPMERILNSTILGRSSPKHEAAILLQKVYKSFRTRRKLADCAILVEQSWWNLLDFAQLKHSSISFFGLEKNETAVSRWSRARTRAAKVGKGLSKNSKAQKLALQHWLEAIDPRHRYGHNLHFYYVKWLNSQSKEPFFYWLDIGEGKQVNLVDKCSRSELQQQCIKYLGPIERKDYEVAVEGGSLYYCKTGELLDTTGEQVDAKWIFVLSTSRTLYVGKKKKGSFQHSSFLAGGATLAAGRIVAEKGILKAVWPHSGHYRPTQENFLDFISFLREENVNLSDVKLDPIDDASQDSTRGEGYGNLNNSSEDELDEKDHLEKEENCSKDSGFEVNICEKVTSAASISHGSKKRPSALLIPSKHAFMETVGRKSQPPAATTTSFHRMVPLEEAFSSIESMNTMKECYKSPEEFIYEESIFQRISLEKETESYQLGKEFPSKWSNGAGPRIGCLRDYPSELRYHALEQVNLSPRSERRIRFDFASPASTPTSLTLSHIGNLLYQTLSSPIKGT